MSAAGMPDIRVQETSVRHASDQLRWLDGTSSPTLEPATMVPVDRALLVRLEAPPPDLVWLHKPGRTALWRKVDDAIVAGEATEVERTRPDFPLYDLAGTLLDPTGAFNPRRFAVRVGDGGGHGLALYPSPQGTRFGTGGGLQGAVRFDGGVDPALAGRLAAWALLDLSVTVSDADTRVFRAQCDGKGDFRLSLWNLPPLPQGSALYTAELSVRADPAASGQVPLDPDALPAVSAAPPGPPPDPPPDEEPFGASVALSLIPGQIHRVSSHGRGFLAVRPLPVPEP